MFSDYVDPLFTDLPLRETDYSRDIIPPLNQTHASRISLFYVLKTCPDFEGQSYKQTDDVIMRSHLELATSDVFLKTFG